MAAAGGSAKTWQLGSFTLITSQRLLLRGDEPVALGSRAFDLLLRLVESAGEVVAKDDLIAAAWPDAVIDEGNLRVHIAAVRRALAPSAGSVKNVPLRGYAYVGPAREAVAPREQRELAPREARLPSALKRIFGREEDLTHLDALLGAHRLVTITGTGGIGKTTAALAAAHAFAPRLRDGAVLVELASVSDPKLVPTALAAALGAEVASAAPTGSLVGRLKHAELLLVVDSCDHLLGAAAELVEQILRGSSHVKILVTSREALRAEGERVYRLPWLRAPTRTMSIGAALGSPAVALLLDRVAGVSLDVTDDDVPVLVEICERLDGIPLAFELATALLPLLGLRGLAAQLDDRFAVLTHGARTALPRHRTLRATFDWSYDLLAAPEQEMFRRMAVFRGPASAAAVATVSGGSTDTLLALVDKSLVDVVHGDEPTFRLLESARAYADHQLVARHEQIATRQIHAHFLAKLLSAATDPAALGAWLADLRAAIKWAFSPLGDPALGVRLTLAAMPVWRRSSLYEESRERAEAALRGLDSAAPSLPDETRLRLELHLAIVIAPVSGTGDQTLWHAEQALALATALDATDETLSALWGVWIGKFRLARHSEGLAHAAAFTDAARRLHDPALVGTGQRFGAVNLHLLGRHDEALEHLLPFLALPIEAQRAAKRFTFDERVAALTYRARVAWMQGHIGLALSTMGEAVAEARRLQHDVSLLYALMFGSCPLALGLGDVAAARIAIDEVRALTLSRAAWATWSRCHEAMLLVLEGEHRGGISAIAAALDRLEPRYITSHSWTWSFAAEAHLAIGQPAEALATLHVARTAAAANEEGWVLPELTRLETLARLDLGEATACGRYQHGLLLARDQGSLFWELRLATSGARTYLRRGDHGRVRELLGSIVARFASEPAAADVVAARVALAEAERG